MLQADRKLLLAKHCIESESPPPQRHSGEFYRFLGLIEGINTIIICISGTEHLPRVPARPLSAQPDVVPTFLSKTGGKQCVTCVL